VDPAGQVLTAVPLFAKMLPQMEKQSACNLYYVYTYAKTTLAALPCLELEN